MDSLGPDAFDFWIGEWDCAFEGGHAVNRISREFGGKVVQEKFEADAPRQWSGMSVSVFSEHDGQWHQTWVDESGSYWHFVGELVDGDPCFATPVPVDADDVYKRMVFSHITDEGFEWSWESSPDRASWSQNWHITYSRQDQA